MNPTPETRDSLLVRLHDAADWEAWQEFAAIYRPLVYRIGRRCGLQDADAQDLTQRVLLSVSRSIERWQSKPQRARFRTWLHTVAKNAVIDHLRAANLVVAEGGTTAQVRLHENADGRLSDAEAELERDYRREVFRWAARGVRDEFAENTWLAFWLSAVEGRPIPEVADELGKSVGAIYVARSRIIQRLRDKVTEYESEATDSPRA